MDFRLTEEAAASNFTQPPPSRAGVKAIDVHTHTHVMPEASLLMQAADLYGIDTLVVIAREHLEPAAIANGWAGRVLVAPQLRYDLLEDEKAFAVENRRRVEEAHRRGARLIKFWFTPRFYAMTRLRLDDPRLAPVLERIQELGLGLLVHVSDPDIWFERVYTDRALYGSKADQYPPLEAVLERYPRTSVIAAHMGGDPEHLDHLQALLDRYPNLYLDTSATKWMIRELGRRRDEARAFIIRNAERILFGTDQVVTANSDLVRYTSRYWAHRIFWETDAVCPSPVEDPDCDGMPVIRGLSLPSEVLARVYRTNAERVLRLSD
ncbi:MAG: amidohydrolase family protein [Bacillota bacterium]